MRSPLLFILLTILSLDQGNANDKIFENATKIGEDDHKLDCIKDIGVKPLESLRGVRPYYQIFVIDLTAPVDTIALIRHRFAQAVCLYAAASNHIRIGYVAFVNKHKVISAPSVPNISELIGMWTESVETFMEGIGKERQETPLNNCEKADLLGDTINRLTKLAKTPIRFFMINDQKSDDQSNDTCDKSYEFGKALGKRNISLDNFLLDEIVVREKHNISEVPMSKAPIFTMSSLDDTEVFMKGMKSFIESLQKQESWNSEGLKSLIKQNEHLEHNDTSDHSEHAIINEISLKEFPDADNKTAGSEENVTNPNSDGKEEKGVETTASPSPTVSTPSTTVTTTDSTTVTTTTTNSSTVPGFKRWTVLLFLIVLVFFVVLLVTLVRRL